MGSSPSSEGVLTGSAGCSEGLGFGLSALSRATPIFGICTRIFTALQDAVDSVGVVDRYSGTLVDRSWLVYVDRCSVVGVDRHQCDPPKLIKLSTSKSPSCSFFSFTTCQKVLLVETLSSSIGSSPSFEGVLTGSGGCSEGGDGYRSIGGDGYRSILASECRSTLLLEEKDEYGVYRDDREFARDLDGHTIPVHNKDIRRLLERASRDEPAYICLPEHASQFTQTKLVPEIYTKDEINEMFYGVCSEHDTNKEAFLMKLDGVYYQLNDRISWLTTCMEEMKQDIARIQNATGTVRPQSIDI
ncbi:hypothetical protein F2Q70_00004111 [Brassica cretica]|uniref:Uncharacterized protein n=1 Tax=Brassica cretica TaxID=69181 RepID=A0A8S9IKP3_BRACR|nr:hypothetical protein F2Q70_00004111 [Brassica cretica]